jgi:hypothetical protein
MPPLRSGVSTNSATLDVTANQPLLKNYQSVLSLCACQLLDKGEQLFKSLVDVFKKFINSRKVFT